MARRAGGRVRGVVGSSEVSGRASRAKGRRGQAEFSALLASRDWTAVETNNGKPTEDFLAIDTSGVVWSVEVKNCAGIMPAHKRQAMDQAKKRRARWMLASHIEGSSSWLVQRQGERPCVWHVQEV